MKSRKYTKKREIMAKRIEIKPKKTKDFLGNTGYNKILVISVIVLIVLVLLVLKKPSITGKVILGEEKIYSENLNIEKNGSGTYEWIVKNPGRITSLKATGSVTANGSAKVYIEKNGTKYLVFDSTNQLFDINIHVLPDYKNIFQGEKILVEISLLNLRGFGAGNVNVKYSIKDSKGNLIAVQEETTYIETQAKFVRELVLPQEIKPSTYVAFVEVSADDKKLGSSSDTFEVVSRFGEGYGEKLKYYFIGLALLVAITTAAIYSVKILNKKRRIAEIKEKEPEERLNKLELELKALGGARKSGFISEQSYQKERKRLEDKLESLKKEKQITKEA